MQDSPHSLYRAALAGTLLLVGLFVFHNETRSSLHLLLGLAMLIAAMLPALRWARRMDSSIPLLPIFSIPFLNTFAFPLLNGHRGILAYPDATITHASLVVLCFQAGIIFTDFSLHFRPGRGEFFERDILGPRFRSLMIGGLALFTLYSGLVAFSSLIPSALAGGLRAVFTGIGLVCIFVCLRDWGAGTLTQGRKATILCLLLVLMLIQLSSLLMVASISLICLALIGYVSSARRIPWVALTATFLLLAVLHNGKPGMRALYWPANDKSPPLRELSLPRLPAFYAEWLELGLQVKADDGDSEAEELTGKLLERSSLLHMLCLVVHYTPERIPYLDGLTYWDIPGQFVPRILWPEKPGAHVSTTRLSVTYGLQREEDTVKTTIGFGMLPEAYANFGFTGAFLLALSMGTLLKYVEQRTRNSPLLSLAGICLIIFTAWAFQTEFPLSLWLSSLFQACLTVVGLPFLYRKLFG